MLLPDELALYHPEEVPPDQLRNGPFYIVTESGNCFWATSTNSYCLLNAIGWI
jgi:hypothetical protein